VIRTHSNPSYKKAIHHFSNLFHLLGRSKKHHTNPNPITFLGIFHVHLFPMVFPNGFPGTTQREIPNLKVRGQRLSGCHDLVHLSGGQHLAARTKQMMFFLDTLW
jgi:hypothetical protein